MPVRSIALLGRSPAGRHWIWNERADCVPQVMPKAYSVEVSQSATLSFENSRALMNKGKQVSRRALQLDTRKFEVIGSNREVPDVALVGGGWIGRQTRELHVSLSGDAPLKTERKLRTAIGASRAEFESDPEILKNATVVIRHGLADRFEVRMHERENVGCALIVGVDGNLAPHA